MSYFLWQKYSSHDIILLTSQTFISGCWIENPRLVKKQDHENKLSRIRLLQMHSYGFPWKSTSHSIRASKHRAEIPAQFMLCMQCCQAALSLTLSCDNPSSVTHKLLLFWGNGEDVRAIVIQPVSLSSQDDRYCSSTTRSGEMGRRKGGQPAAFL